MKLQSSQFPICKWMWANLSSSCTNSSYVCVLSERRKESSRNFEHKLLTVSSLSKAKLNIFGYLALFITPSQGSPQKICQTKQWYLSTKKTPYLGSYEVPSWCNMNSRSDAPADLRHYKISPNAWPTVQCFEFWG